MKTVAAAAAAVACCAAAASVYKTVKKKPCFEKVADLEQTHQKPQNS